MTEFLSKYRVTKIKSLVWASLLLCLVGCVASPYNLGFSQEEWHRLPKAERTRLLHNYREIHKASASDRGNTELGIGSSLQVAIAEGQVRMPPFTQFYSYEPISFRIHPGECKRVFLQESSGVDEGAVKTDHYKQPGDHQVELAVCFKKGVLLLDASHYDLKQKEGSVRLYRSPLWREGFSYLHINSTGYARLHDVTISVKFAED